ncbi:ArfGap-domain-containing protein [Gymnopus androsaceus JB14]|uniref:ArfGap-domain-containing protein n=1 Tax=Gymnopus androsaceus JB14 TaxID=1447944 RepID=A0A6A4HM07_9AGAR|nr:ArfGap-domain-containing protein [Gymnopus androsaceus JB14]
MSRQDKATTERHAKLLRELVKRPDNKLCADCKRNDARWASWNLGVYICIRCSGIHRSMGTHISKVKSVDLDTWTPEQMESIQKWGNRLANLYWEAHLKQGHIPPEHKIDSFIRSKYESRRWALEGPPPTDPSVLSTGAAPVPEPPSAPATPVQQAHTPTRATHAQTSSFSATRSTAPTSTKHQLLSAGIVNRPVGVVPAAPQTAAPAPPAPAPAPQNDLFSLDFHAPPTVTTNNHSQSTSPEQRKDVKQDILSLFSTPPAQSAPVMGNGFGQFSGAPAQTASPWGAAQAPVQAPVTSMMGSNGTGMWGASSGWNNAATAMPAQSNVWGSPAAAAIPQQQQPNLFASGSDIWGDLFGSFSTAAPVQQKKDDAFGDIWGGFK